jgi:O-antigen/teichoic acid export membrane protein
VVVPLAFRRAAREGAAPAPRDEAAPDEPELSPDELELGPDELDLSRGGRFAVAVLVIMAAEQTLLNGAVITTDLTATDAAVAGFVFNVLLIARAPLQLFQAIQGSLLPHLAGLEARAGRDEARRAVRITLLAIAGFAGAVALGLLALGPWVMSILFDDAGEYGRFGLALVALGLGFHLAAGTLNQAALARDHAAAAAAAWLIAAVAFVIWLVAPVVDNELVRAEIGYLGAATLLCGLLALVDRRGQVSSATNLG